MFSCLYGTPFFSAHNNSLLELGCDRRRASVVDAQVVQGKRLSLKVSHRQNIFSIESEVFFSILFLGKLWRAALSHDRADNVHTGSLAYRY